MKVIVLGGAGEMAARAVEDLLTQDDVEEVVLADINRDKAADFARQLNSSRVSVTDFDAEDHEGAVQKIKGYDVACGAVGPFYRFEKKVVSACLEAGVDYVSICDDHDAIKSVLPLDDQAREKGVAVITGMGWTPGMSNLMACEGFRELGNVREINVYWGGSASDSEGFAVILHTLHIFDGVVPVFIDGNEIEVKAGSEPQKVDFGSSLGEVFTYNVGHPEPVTLPRYLTGVQKVTLKGGLKENSLNHLTRCLASLRLTGTPRKKQVLGKIVNSSMPLLKKLGPSTGCSGIRVDVYGEKDGEKCHQVYRAVDRMKNLTGLPLAVGALMLGRGQVSRTGVFAPEAEGGISPHTFREELSSRGIHIEKKEYF